MLVDDEARIVQGLQRALRMHRESWEVLTATSGPAALELFASQEIDVIISDMRMPEMDGATLLGEVKRSHPKTMRIVLSGQTDAAAAFRALPVAHQFLSKPTDPSVIGELLVRAAAMKTALPDETIHAEIGRLDALPTPRALRDELAFAIADGQSVCAVTALVERDPAMTFKLLQTVNSAFFGLRRRICDIGEAIAYLGMEIVASVCGVGGTTNAPGSERAVAVASLARRLAGGHEAGAAAYATGLFTDLGRLAIAAMPTPRGPDLELPIAAYLLDLAGLPRIVVEALLEQTRSPSRSAERANPTPADAVWIASQIVDGKSIPAEYRNKSTMHE